MGTANISLHEYEPALTATLLCFLFAFTNTHRQDSGLARYVRPCALTDGSITIPYVAAVSGGLQQYVLGGDPCDS